MLVHLLHFCSVTELQKVQSVNAWTRLDPYLFFRQVLLFYWSVPVSDYTHIALFLQFAILFCALIADAYWHASGFDSLLCAKRSREVEFCVLVIHCRDGWYRLLQEIFSLSVCRAPIYTKLVAVGTFMTGPELSSVALSVSTNCCICLVLISIVLLFVASSLRTPCH